MLGIIAKESQQGNPRSSVQWEEAYFKRGTAHIPWTVYLEIFIVKLCKFLWRNFPQAKISITMVIWMWWIIHLMYNQSFMVETKVQSYLKQGSKQGRNTSSACSNMCFWPTYKKLYSIVKALLWRQSYVYILSVWLIHGRMFNQTSRIEMSPAPVDPEKLSGWYYHAGGMLTTLIFPSKVRL